MVLHHVDYKDTNEIAPLALALRIAQSRRARGSRTTPTSCDTCQV
jgi:hypothetical protein